MLIYGNNLEIILELFHRLNFHNLDFIIKRIDLAQTQLDSHPGAGPFIKKSAFATHKKSFRRQVYCNSHIVFFSYNAIPPLSGTFLKNVKQFPVARPKTLGMACAFQNRINLGQNFFQRFFFKKRRALCNKMQNLGFIDEIRITPLW